MLHNSFVPTREDTSPTRESTQLVAYLTREGTQLVAYLVALQLYLDPEGDIFSGFHPLNITSCVNWSHFIELEPSITLGFAEQNGKGYYEYKLIFCVPRSQLIKILQFLS